MDTAGLAGYGLSELLIWTALFCILYGLLYGRKVLSIADPLIVFIVTQIFSSTLVAILVRNRWMIIQFGLAQLAFAVGFLHYEYKIASVRIHPDKRQTAIAEATISILFLIWLSVSLYAGVSAGFPLLTSDPSLAKTVVYSGGLGIAKRMTEGIGTIVPVGAFVLSVHGKHKKSFAFVIFISMLLSMLGGSKSSLLLFVYIAGYLLVKTGLLSGEQRKGFKKVIVGLIIAASSTAVLILFLSETGAGSALAALATRILFYGDIVIYYYQPDIFRHFSNFGLIEFIKSNINPVLGEFRIVSYQNPIGFNIIQYKSPFTDFETTTGPNGLFFASAHIYFGLVGGTIYSGVMGWVVANIRAKYLEYQGCSIMKLICLITVAIEIFILPMESPLFVSTIFDTFIPFVAMWMVVTMSYYAALQNRSQQQGCI